MINVAPIVARALDTPEIAAYVNGRVYFFQSEEEIPRPYIGFLYSSGTDTGDKDAGFLDSADLDVYCVADEPAEMLELCEVARAALLDIDEEKVRRITYNSLNLGDLNGLAVGTLNFTLLTEK